MKPHQHPAGWGLSSAAGAVGATRSVYIRAPDQNLIEIRSFAQ
jgi:hypothetical protein